ncbi:MAG: M1 family aminopeptidase [Bacteroidota bacterium]|nr:M1 family aminopeptidase [Bacteroidota bacterium]
MKYISFCIFFMAFSITASSQDIKHKLGVKINVHDHLIEVIDDIMIPGDYFMANPDLTFSLNSNLKVYSPDEKITIQEITEKENKEARVPVKTYSIHVAENNGRDIIISIAYSGLINDDITTGAAEYARGFSETSGIISEKGIYLAGSTQWVPSFRNVELFSFFLEVTIDQEWSVVSQGSRTINETTKGKKRIRYESPEPMDEIYLIGGKWTEYSISTGRVLFQAFLRTPDEKLANKYLGATQGYLSMYEKMIGPYPFTKFALVENFWETGYGMPSFTLLGPKVIRFPWILYSSYPHELLHNYWGNSVYVDYETGNWCEGITVYMADHLLKEQQGQGAEYRQSTLQKYTDFVNTENDFPLIEFLSRNNSAEEAVGYGKCMMMNNMLRTNFGDELFLKAWSKFYNDYKFKQAGFSDIQTCFEAITGSELDSFFEQWTQRPGAPSLKLSGVVVNKTNSSYELSFHIDQTQPEEAFELDIPVYVYLEGETEVSSTLISMNNKAQDYLLKFDEKPVRIEVDPMFQLFRRLDRNEVPTTLTQLFGAKSATIILPSDSPSLDNYKKMAELWKITQEAQGKNMEIVLDNELQELPNNKSIWVIGFENKFYKIAKIPENYFNQFSADEKSKAELLMSEGSLVYSIQNPGNAEFTLGFAGSTLADAIEGLGRKLPHYGKYSYLGFKGTEPENILKGIFPTLGSPLNYPISYNGVIIPTLAKIKPRKALTD